MTLQASTRWSTGCMDGRTQRRVPFDEHRDVEYHAGTLAGVEYTAQSLSMARGKLEPHEGTHAYDMVPRVRCLYARQPYVRPLLRDLTGAMPLQRPCPEAVLFAAIRPCRRAPGLCDVGTAKRELDVVLGKQCCAGPCAGANSLLPTCTNMRVSPGQPWCNLQRFLLQHLL